MGLFGWLAATTSLTSTCAAATIVVLVLGEKATRHSAEAFRPVSPIRRAADATQKCGTRRSSGSGTYSTALFFKNSTKDAGFDIYNGAPNPLRQNNSTSQDAGIATTIATTKEELVVVDDDFAPFDEDCFPGKDENDRYECDESVAFWRDFRNPLPTDDEAATAENFREIRRIVRRFARAGPRAASYFAKHLGRTAYFAGNAVLGNAAFAAFSERNNEDDGDADDPSIERGKNQRGPLPFQITTPIASRLVLEAFLSYEQDYFDGVVPGTYKEPWDATTRGHRQSNPLYAAAQSFRFAREAIGTLGRRVRSTEADKEVAFFAGSGNTATNTGMYPGYYQTAFHYQGDGWMSTDSANVYETSTETLFLGKQDSMQRTSLPPLVSLAKQDFVGLAGTQRRRCQRPMKVLEVACGTGRFLTFVRDNLPLDTDCTAVDLSPFYLEKAAENDAYWRQTKASNSNNRGGGGSDIAPATFVQAKAEALPFADESFDAVVCVYLYHEIPRHIRAKAAAEMARVVRPGGVVVLADSLQKGDRPALDVALPNFQKMNEPFYVDFCNDDLGGHFESAGLIPKTKIVRSNTKSLSFSKPGALPP